MPPTYAVVNVQKVYSKDDLAQFKQQSVIVPNSKTSPGETGTYRSPLTSALTGPDSLVPSLHHVFERAAQINPSAPFLGHRPAFFDPKTNSTKHGDYIWQTWSTVRSRVKKIGDGIVKVFHDHVKQGAEKFHVGIYSLNRPEWTITEYAGYAHSLVNVSLYDTLGPDAVEFIVNHANIQIIFASIDKIQTVLNVSSRCPNLKVIVSFDPLPSTPGSAGSVLRSWCADRNVVLLSFSELEAIGAKNPRQPSPPTSDDISTICYTSGTTGNPKGALLSHGNVLSVLKAGHIQGVQFTPEDIHISYLPLAHVFERVVGTFMMMCGGRIGYWRGDVSLLMEDLQALKPTCFPSVPRLFNRIHGKILQQTLNSGSALKAALFRKALAAKVANMKQSKSLTHALWDKLVFAKVQAVLGGRVKFMISASAPISGEVLNFLRVVFGCEVIEAYGQTETTGGGTLTWFGDYTSGNVGPVLNSCELKLMSVPEMGYTVNDKPYPRGEICFRGNSVFKGYYRDEAKTKETFTADGWLKTGDIGYIDNTGRVTIVDRKKNIFKLAQGEYVAPEKLENIFLKSSLVAQIFVHGDSLQSELVAIVIPDPEVCIPWAKQRNLLPSTIPDPVGPTKPGEPAPSGMAELCASTQFRDIVIQDLTRVGTDGKLRGFEFVKAVVLEKDMFSVENGLLTPTFKLKRNEAVEKYRKVIDAMYLELNSKKKDNGSKL